MLFVPVKLLENKKVRATLCELHGLSVRMIKLGLLHLLEND